MLGALEDRLRNAVRGPVSLAWGAMRGAEVLALDGGRVPYSLASITKPLTATAVMILVERELVDLDAPISTYLEAPLERDAEGATVRRVLDHTAGLPLHHQFFYADEPFAPPPFAETIRRYGKTFWTPGTRYLYSNLGYGLLDSLVARVSGRSYAEFMVQEIFGPLGMAGASIGRPEGAAVPQGDGFAYPPYGFDHPGGSAAFASVEDLLRFGRFHLGHGPFLLSSASLAAMREGAGYGLGWGLDARGFFGHSGSMGGVRTMLRIVPRLDLVLVLVALTNGENDLPTRAVEEAHAALDPSLPPAPFVVPSESPLPEGRWQGAVETHEGERAFSLALGADPTASLGDSSRVEGAAVRNGRIIGTFDGDVGTADAGRRPYRLHLDLTRAGERLEGAVTAISTQGPGERLGNALSYRCSLTRSV